MERLTKYVDSVARFAGEYGEPPYPIVTREAIDRLAYYEDLEEQGRLVVLDEEKALALVAVAHGCNTNRRLVGASYMRDIHSDNPQTISYYRAIEIITELAEAALRKEGEAG